MKRVLRLAIILSLATLNLWAQQWTADFSTAREEATNLNRHILLVFAGSDWCNPCIKLDREIWSSPEFQSLAEDQFVMLKADFPRKKQNQLSSDQQVKNNQLAKRYNSQGIFPLVVLLNAEGKVMAKTGYKRLSPSAYYNHLKDLIQLP